MSDLNDVTRIGTATQRAVQKPLAKVIEMDSFSPRLLALVSNALAWRESDALRREFDLGTSHWRVVSVLAIRPGITATEISTFTAMNKGVISRSVRDLLNRGFATMDSGPRGTQPLFLTSSGAKLHDAMFPISVRGQEIVDAALGADQTAELNRLLQLVIDSMRADRLIPQDEYPGGVVEEDVSEDDDEDVSIPV